MPGRPYKQGLDYFFLDTSIEEDEKIQAIEADHKCLGFTIYIKMLCRIYRTHGYFTMFTSKQQKLYSNSINVDINSLNAVINSCLDEQLFDRCLYEKFGILTSKSIQMRFLYGCYRRKSVNVIKDFCILSQEEVLNVNKTTSFLIYDNINSIIVNNNIINDYTKYAIRVINVKSLSLSLSVFSNNIIYNINNEEILKENYIEKNTNMAEIKKTVVSVKTLKSFEISYLDDGNTWQREELEKFLVNNEIAFETILMNTPVLQKEGMYQTVIQKFVHHFQSSGESKGQGELTKHFRNWLKKIAENGNISAVIDPPKILITGSPIKKEVNTDFNKYEKK